MKKVLITGTAGFIGFHLSNKLISEGYEVFGLDSINEYYDVKLKLARLSQLGFDTEQIKYNKLISSKTNGHKFIKVDLKDKENIDRLFRNNKFEIVINLAAQAGVRYSLENPYEYVDTNVSGFLNILEACRNNSIEHLVFASSSSVYGLNETIPFKESDLTDHPISMYAATKKNNELMAHTYAHLFDLPCTGLRFFTVYGPWGRPDMALFLFTDAIVKGKSVKIFNDGEMYRDFTYVDDIVDGISRVLTSAPLGGDLFDAKRPISNISSAKYKIFNIGNSNPVSLMDFVKAIEEKIGKKAIKEFLPMQPGDVLRTFAETKELNTLTGFKPQTTVDEGVANFIDWYLDYHSKR